MAEYKLDLPREDKSGKEYEPKLRYRGRLGQVRIYFGKMVRMLVYQGDWKVLPLSALIAGIVGLVINSMYFKTMEGTLQSAFCISCAALWNGCFNSIQVICRERNIIKREHRAGMHISSYIAAHMIYQALLCLVQTIIALYIFRLMEVAIPAEGFITRWMYVDIGITYFLVSYASDMMAILISSLVHSTTMAMTVMPFVLIFQLVFSGGIVTLPEWCEDLTHFTITHYGLDCLAAQADINNKPMMAVWNTLNTMRNEEVSVTVTVGRVLDTLSDDSNPIVLGIREKEVSELADPEKIWAELQNTEYWQELSSQEIDTRLTIKEILAFLQSADSMEELRNTQVGLLTLGDLVDLLAAAAEDSKWGDTPVTQPMTVGELTELLQPEELISELKKMEDGQSLTVGDIIDFVAASPDVQARRDKEITASARVEDLLNLAGEEEVRDFVIEKTSEAGKRSGFDMTIENIFGCWAALAGFILLFAVLSVLVLEFIDRDKR